MYTITVPGKPKAMERPRVGVSRVKARGAPWNPDVEPRRLGIHVYIPKDTIAYEQLVAAEAMAAGVKRIGGAVGIEISAYVYAPHPRTTEMDVDNASKTILDGLKNVAYDDDGQVELLTVRKFYVGKGEQKAVVRIGRLEEFEPVSARSIPT